MKYLFCYKLDKDGELIKSFPMKYNEAFQLAYDICLLSRGGTSWVEREDGIVTDRFHKFYVQEQWGSMIGGPVFIHEPLFIFGKLDWKKTGF